MTDPHQVLPGTSGDSTETPARPTLTLVVDRGRRAAAPLTERSVAFFRYQGYLRIEACFGAEELAVVREALDEEFAAAREPIRRGPSGRVVRLSRLWERGPAFRDVLAAPRLLASLASLLGPNVDLVLNRHNHATINVEENKAQRLHRDVLQWSRPVVTALVYVDDAPLEGGATVLIPGSHFLPFVGTPNNGGTWMDEHHVFGEFLDQAVPVPMRAGDVLLFDSLVFHAAGTNGTDGQRRVVSGAYCSVDELAIPAELAERQLVLGERLYRGDS